METVTTTDSAALSAAGLAAEASAAKCVHCGAVCRALAVRQQDQHFCCHGCLTVFELLQENGLGDFYQLAAQPGVRVKQAGGSDRFTFLDDASVRERLLDFSDGRTDRVTFQIPGIHCVACVWLLENLFKLHSGVGRSVVDFEKKQVTVTFEAGQIRLSQLACLLSSIGYEPVFNLGSLDRPDGKPGSNSLYLKLGVAGFAFGNIMLFSVCLYSGMDRFSAPVFQPLFGWVSLILSLPVLVYSASSYWRAAWLGLKQQTLTLDLPIALGLIALFGQSLHEVGTGSGVGYLDSLSGLVFFLLIGRIFQDRTYQRLSFDRDYKSFFPLAVKRLESGGERTVSLSGLAVGDRLRLRQGELIPADARVVVGEGLIDYSFVTGESEPVACGVGDALYAGGRQVGGAMDLEITKPVSQGYLTSLWSHQTFAKISDKNLNTVLNRFSRGFTLGVISVAFVAGAWWWSQDVSRAIRAFTSVLIVACPCALALSAPFALGTGQRLLGRFNVFLRNANVMETLAGVGSIVFDKTGTLTSGAGGSVRFAGDPLSPRDAGLVRALAAQSAHPSATRIAASLGEQEVMSVEAFEEVVGKGIRGRVSGHDVCLGSAAFMQEAGFPILPPALEDSSTVHLALDDGLRGNFALRATVRPRVAALLSQLSGAHDVLLLSGDNDQERQRFESLMGRGSRLHFQQSPADKLEAIAALQQKGGSVMMVGDGLNDAGALRQSDVGVAVVEAVGTFSPASDVIMEAADVPALAAILRFARGSVAVVWSSIGLSLVYNLVGLAFAATGQLSPIVCAILMPLSSITVVTFACLAVGWMARKARLAEALKPERIS